MVNRLIFILMMFGLYFFISCGETSSEKHLVPKNFEEIQISFATGDEVIQSYGMVVYDSAGLVKTKFSSPISQKNQPEGKLTFRTLDENDLQAIYNFIKKAKSQNDTCSFLSSSLDRYKIKVGIIDSISIMGNCSWDGMDYRSLTERFYNK